MARRTVSTRSACVIVAARAASPACAAGAIGRRLLALDAEPVGAFDTVERQREAAEVLRRHRLLARSELSHRAERQRPQGLGRDEGATPFGAGLPRALPFLGKAISLALQADQAVHGRGGTRTLAAPRTNPRDDSRPWWRRPRWLRPRRPGLRPAAARPVSTRSRTACREA